MKKIKFATDKEWERFGEKNPYYGVISHDKYNKNKLSKELKKEFFDSGSDYTSHILNNVYKFIGSDKRITNAIDFGCGVGRVAIPLAEIADWVLGIDISDAMLDEARSNCEARSINNLVFKKFEDGLHLDNSFDLIHSYIVFQHLDPDRGLEIFQNLMSYLAENGVGVMHFTFASEARDLGIIRFVKKNIPLSKNIINLAKGREFFSPQMEMNSYDLNNIFSAIYKLDVKSVFCEYTNHSGKLGLIFYFQKLTAASISA